MLRPSFTKRFERDLKRMRKRGLATNHGLSAKDLRIVKSLIEEHLPAGLQLQRTELRAGRRAVEGPCDLQGRSDVVPLGRGPPVARDAKHARTAHR